MKTYYATCDANGPISRKIVTEEHDSLSDVREMIASSGREWIDGCATDAENDFEIEGDGMSEAEFAEEMESSGATLVEESDILGDWKIWEIQA
jgi:hypothetical protein